MSSSHAASIVEASPACGGSCCGHLPASVTPQGVAEPKILYEHCVRPSGVRGNSSGGSSRRLSPAPMVLCTSAAEAVGATATCTVCECPPSVPREAATADKMTQTTAATTPSQELETPKAKARLESASATADAGRQSNEEVHNTTVEDAGEASERDWSSETAAASVAAAADEASADAASLSTWPLVDGGLLLSELPFRRLPVLPPPSRGLLLKRKRTRSRKSQFATTTAARVMTLRQRHAAAVQLPSRQQQQEDDEAVQQPQQHHMPLLEWTLFATVDRQPHHRAAINRPVRRAIRELSKLILCGILLVLCGNLLLAAGIVLQWNIVTYEGHLPGRELCAAAAAAADDDFADYAAAPVVGHRLY